MKITLCSGSFGWDYLIVAEDGSERLIQTDWDYPGIASTFGWVPCKCGRTDGTIDCAHKTAMEMIADAQSYLDEHIGETVEDPGYFDEE